MSYSRLVYDPDAYEQILFQSTSVGKYSGMTPLPYPVGRVDERHTDTESELMGLDRKISKDMKSQYSPDSVDPSRFPKLRANFDVYRDALFPEVTRISNPPQNVRGMGVNRFEWLPERFQDKAIEPMQWPPANDTMNAKDTHRTAAPSPIDVRASLPPPAPERVAQPKYVFPPVPTLPMIMNTHPPQNVFYGSPRSFSSS